MTCPVLSTQRLRGHARRAMHESKLETTRHFSRPRPRSQRVTPIPFGNEKELHSKNTFACPEGRSCSWPMKSAGRSGRGDPLAWHARNFLHFPSLFTILGSRRTPPSPCIFAREPGVREEINRLLLAMPALGPKSRQQAFTARSRSDLRTAWSPSPCV